MPCQPGAIVPMETAAAFLVLSSPALLRPLFPDPLLLFPRPCFVVGADSVWEDLSGLYKVPCSPHTPFLCWAASSSKPEMTTARPSLPHCMLAQQPSEWTAPGEGHAGLPRMWGPPAPVVQGDRGGHSALRLQWGGRGCPGAALRCEPCLSRPPRLLQLGRALGRKRRVGPSRLGRPSPPLVDGGGGWGGGRSLSGSWVLRRGQGCGRDPACVPGLQHHLHPAAHHGGHHRYLHLRVSL